MKRLFLPLAIAASTAHAQGREPASPPAAAPTSPPTPGAVPTASPSPGAAPPDVVVPTRESLPNARRMTLDECVALSARKSPDAITGDLEVAGAEAARSAVKGEFFPRLRAEGSALQWDGAFELPFAIPGASGPPPVLTVRDAFTWTGTVTVVQPLVGLFAIYDHYKARDFGVDVASVRRDATRRDVAFRVAEAYVRLLEATRLAEIARASVAQLEGQRRQAQSLYANGVVGKTDVLRAALALATARERVLDSEGRIVLGRARLATLMGLPIDAPIEAASLGGEPPQNDLTLASAEARAVAQRLEIREVDAKIREREEEVGFARAKLLPEVSAVGNYTHYQGSAFQQKNAAYAGVTAGWTAWDWGTTLSAVDEAKVRRDQAQVLRTKVADELRLEARQAFVNAGTAREALAVARAALGQAEENYRIVSKRFAASSATSFDVVDAEALLTQARARVETALYGYHAARFALQRATGDAAPRLP